MIAQVVTIAPLPLLYYVSTFYIAHYTSSTTRLSQPTHIFNELTNEGEKKEGKKRNNKKERKEEKKGKEKENT